MSELYNNLQLEDLPNEECDRLYNEDLKVQKQFGKFGRNNNSKKR